MRALRTLLLAGLIMAISVPLLAGPPSPVYPLKLSANGRYLVDQNNVPFLVVGDAPHDLVNRISLGDAATYLSNRQSYDVNSLWVEVVCNSYTLCNSDGTTYDGIAPFNTPGDVSTPNSVYFDKLDAILNLAAARGMTVFLDPTETGGWMGIFRSNGAARMRAYGQYLGNRYKNFPNIVWLEGNDFQTWRDPDDDALILAVADGIRSVDTNHLHTVQLDYYVSNSLNDSNWASRIQLNAAYTYYPTYAEVRNAYNQPNPLPVFLAEANYEFENNNGIDTGTSEVLRRQEYWSILGGAVAGHIYGSGWVWAFPAGWENHLDTPGAAQLQIMKSFFTGYSWFSLIPDQNQTLVTAGYGTYATSGSIISNDYVTSARTANGTLAIAYIPTLRTITVDLAQMAAPVTARWFDPSNGTFTTIGTIANTGSHQFTTPGNNNDGTGDWVLLLEVPPGDTTPPTISGVTVSNITSTGAMISWTTNEPADSQVEYGLTSAYGVLTPLNTALVTTHTVTLTGLTENTTYHYRVKSKDGSGNLASNTDAAFSTLDLPAPVISALTAPTPGLNLSVAPYFGGDFTLVVSGQYFVAGAVVGVGSSRLTTTFVNSTELSAAVSASVLANLGMQDVQVINPDGHGSNVLSLSVVQRGDINGSGSVNIGDALLCALTTGGVTKPPLSLSVGDINLSGTSNIGDCLAGALFSGHVNINFNVPTVTSVSPSIAIPGFPLTITGTGLSPGTATTDTAVLFTTAGNGTVRVTPSTASSGNLTVTVPGDAVSGPLQVYRLDTPLGGTEFPLQVSGSTPPLVLTDVNPLVNVAGNVITLTGLGFDATAANNTVHFATSAGTVAGTVTSVDPTLSRMTAIVPGGASCGPVTVEVAGQTSNARMLMVVGTTCTLQLIDIWKGGGPGDMVVIEGAGFDIVNASNNVVRFTAAGGGTVIAPVLAAGGTQLHVRIPNTAAQGSVTVQVGAAISNALQFVPAHP